MVVLVADLHFTFFRNQIAMDRPMNPEVVAVAKQNAREDRAAYDKPQKKVRDDSCEARRPRDVFRVRVVVRVLLAKAVRVMRDVMENELQ